jgi:hypothetical protein
VGVWKSRISAWLDRLNPAGDTSVGPGGLFERRRERRGAWTLWTSLDSAALQPSSKSSVTSMSTTSRRCSPIPPRPPSARDQMALAGSAVALTAEGTGFGRRPLLHQLSASKNCCSCSVHHRRRRSKRSTPPMSFHIPMKFGSPASTRRRTNSPPQAIESLRIRWSS